MQSPTKFEYAQARAYIRRATPGDPAYSPPRASKIYARFSAGIENVVAHEFQQRRLEREQALREYMQQHVKESRAAREGGSRGEPPAPASSD